MNKNTAAAAFFFFVTLSGICVMIAGLCSGLPRNGAWFLGLSVIMFLYALDASGETRKRD